MHFTFQGQQVTGSVLPVAAVQVPDKKPHTLTRNRTELNFYQTSMDYEPVKGSSQSHRQLLLLYS